MAMFIDSIDGYHRLARFLLKIGQSSPAIFHNRTRLNIYL